MTSPSPPGLGDPFAVGRLRIDGRLLMAPMAGVTAMSFRRSVRRWGAALVHTEMISAAGVWHGNRRTLDYLACGADEHPIGYQLFGSQPGMVAHAAEVAVRQGADLVDLNMACPVRKVISTGAGAALLAQPETAAALVRAAVDAVGDEVPVTVKIRAGLRGHDLLGLQLAPRLAEAGAAAICLHPRSAAQLYGGRADHGLTARLCRQLTLPVIASGDVFTREECDRLLAAGAAAVMVARAAIGRPWVFQEILTGRAASPHEQLDELRRFATETVEERGDRAVAYLRQFWPRARRAGALDRVTASELMAATSALELLAVLAVAESPTRCAR